MGSREFFDKMTKCKRYYPNCTSYPGKIRIEYIEYLDEEGHQGMFIYFKNTFNKGTNGKQLIFG